MPAPIDKSNEQNKYHGFIFSSSDFIILYNVKNKDIDKINIIIPIVVFAAIFKLFYVKHYNGGAAKFTIYTAEKQ